MHPTPARTHVRRWRQLLGRHKHLALAVPEVSEVVKVAALHLLLHITKGQVLLAWRRIRKGGQARLRLEGQAGGRSRAAAAGHQVLRSP